MNISVKSICIEITKMFGNLKFAVFIILIFASALCLGTFQESYHGTDYANRFVYKSNGFFILQFLMFLSILTATIQRLPPRKNLYGFYTLHLGLLTLFIGSFITFYKGIDGSMTLLPGVPNKEVILGSDVLRIQETQSGKSAELLLPFTPKEIPIDQNWEPFKVKRYLPFAKKNLRWTSYKHNENSTSSTQYLLVNDQFEETLTFSLRQSGDFTSSAQLGPLSVHYLPKGIFQCFKEFPQDDLFVWDIELEKCYGTSNKQLIRSKNGQNEFLTFSKNSKKIQFFPSYSPLPVILNKDGQVINTLKDLPYRVFNKKLFTSSPHLLYFGTSIAFFDKNLEEWVAQDFSENTSKLNSIDLPWMGFRTSLLKHTESEYPENYPEGVIPTQDNNAIIEGNFRAIEMEVTSAGKTQNFIVYLDQPVELEVAGVSYRIHLKKLTKELNFELKLTEFKMEKDPGTENPASYESFVSLRSPSDSISAHIFMNNPLKYSELTFYQASYFPTDSGQYGSVLSVNYDPGRAIKYVGAILLVFGSIWHFYFLRRKKTAHSTKAT